MQKQTKDQVRVTANMRYPPDLHEALTRLARDHKRSLNAEVMWALQLYVEQQEAAHRRRRDHSDT